MIDCVMGVKSHYVCKLKKSLFHYERAYFAVAAS